MLKEQLLGRLDSGQIDGAELSMEFQDCTSLATLLAELAVPRGFRRDSGEQEQRPRRQLHLIAGERHTTSAGHARVRATD